MNTPVKIVKNLLLVFILISIGFLLGKHYNSEKIKANYISTSAKSEKTGIKKNKTIHVYYMHSTFRCVTCNTIEKMTKTLLKSKYSVEMQKKSLIFSDIDFQTDEKLAKKFGIVSSCVVVALEERGKIIDFKRLDDVWRKMEKPAVFNAYISGAIQKYLKEENYSGDQK